MSAGFGGHAGDPVTTKRMVTGLKRAYPLTRQALDGEAEADVELSLGLAIGSGGCSKGKATAGEGHGFLNGSASAVAGPVGTCRARLPGSLNGSGFASMLAGRVPRVVSGSRQSGFNSRRHQSVQQAVANPIVNLNHCTKPQCYANPNRVRVMGGKRMRRDPSFSESSAGGARSRSSGELTQSNSNPKAGVQEAMSKPRTPPIMPCVMTRGIDGRKTSGVLYRYSNQTEICIVCICHGEPFTPAEFVRHAGGAESSHPLRQIVVVVSPS